MLTVMPLNPFQPKDETRLVKHMDTVYKVKIKYENSRDGKQRVEKTVFHRELEEVLRAILLMEQEKEKLLQIKTHHLLISPKKCYWKAAEKLGFKQNNKVLKAHPFLIILTVQICDGDHFGLHSAPVLRDLTTRSDIEKKRKVSSNQESVVKQCQVVLKKLPSNVTNHYPQHSAGKSRKNCLSNVGVTSSEGSGREMRQMKRKECVSATKTTTVQIPSRNSQIPKDNQGITEAAKTNSRGRTRKHKLYTPSLNPLEIVPGGQVDHSVENQGIRSRDGTDTNNRQQLDTFPTVTALNSPNVSKATKIVECKQTQNSPNESRRLRSMSIHNSFALKELKTAKVIPKDRYSIQLEELEEDRKLENLAKSMSPNNYPTRKRSRVWNFIDTITTPLKKLLKQ